MIQSASLSPFNKQCAAFSARRHPDSEMRPEPSTILRYLLQVGGSQALSSLEAHDIPPAARELGADVSVGQYLHSDLQETYLRYANSAVNNEAGYEGNIKRSTVSKQVHVNEVPGS